MPTDVSGCRSPRYALPVTLATPRVTAGSIFSHTSDRLRVILAREHAWHMLGDRKARRLFEVLLQFGHEPKVITGGDKAGTKYFAVEIDGEVSHCCETGRLHPSEVAVEQAEEG